MTDDEPPVTDELDVLVAWLRYSSSAADAAIADAIDHLRARVTAAEAICDYYDDPGCEDDAALGLYHAWRAVTRGTDPSWVQALL